MVAVLSLCSLVPRLNGLFDIHEKRGGGGMYSKSRDLRHPIEPCRTVTTMGIYSPMGRCNSHDFAY